MTWGDKTGRCEVETLQCTAFFDGLAWERGLLVWGTGSRRFEGAGHGFSGIGIAGRDEVIHVAVFSVPARFLLNKSFRIHTDMGRFQRNGHVAAAGEMLLFP